MTRATASLPRIIVVDDDTPFRQRLIESLSERGFRVRGACDAKTALSLANEFSPERAVIDLRMPGGSGIELLEELRALLPGIRIVVLTGFGSIQTAVQALRLGAVHYLTKPISPEQLLAAFGDQEANVTNDPQLNVPSLDTIEHEYINRVIDECGGNISQASKLLGLHRRSLQRKLKRCGILSR